jgi:LDH2 family malate/lactate/ureidoglycolate dehydrogenase
LGQDSVRLASVNAASRLRALGFSDADATMLADHFLDADRRGKVSHGVSRIEWLEAFVDLDPHAVPVKAASSPGFDRWEGRGALGYVTLAAICDDLERHRPRRVKVVAAAQCFPTGMLGYWVRRLANAGLVAMLTATSPARLPHPDGGEPLVGTNPLAIGLPSSEGEPIVVDVSMGKVTHGDVLRGVAGPEDLVPFGGDQAHKSFALAIGLQGWVESFVGEGYGAVLVVAKPEFDGFASRLRVAAGERRLPGDAGRRRR